MTVLANLVVRIGGDIKDFEKSTKALTKNLNKIGGSLERGGKTMTGFVTGPILAAVGGLTLIATKTAAAADRIDKMSQRVGMSRETFQEWDFILSQSGSNIESMQMGMKTLSQRMDEAMRGVGSGAELFDRLGIAIDESLSQEDAFDLVVRSLQGMEAGVEKAALAQQLFGRTGQELLPLLNESRGSIDELRQRARDLGLVLGDEAVDAGVQLTDALDQMKRSMGNAAAAVAAGLMPVVKELVGVFIERGIPALRDFAERLSGLITWFTDLPGPVQKVIGVTIGLLAAIGPVMIIVGKTILAVSTLIKTFGALIAIGKLLVAGLGLLLSPVGLVVAAIAAAIAIGWLLWKNWDEVKAKVTEIWQVFSDWFRVLWDGLSTWFSGLISGIGDFLAGTFTAITDTARGVWQSFKDWFLGAWDAIKAGIGVAIDFLKDLFFKFHPLGLIIKHWEPLTEFFADLWDGIKGTVRSAINGILGFINGLIAAVERMVNAIGSAINRIPRFSVPGWVPKIGGKSFGLPKIPTVSLPKIPLMDTGGIVRGPGLFQVGPGVTEAVTRVDRGMRPGPSAVNIHFHGPVYGVLDFEQRVKSITRDAIQGGAFRGLIPGV